MPRSDRAIIGEVIREWRRRADDGIVVPTALGMLMRLEGDYGDRVTVEGACDALEELSTIALQVRDNIKSIKVTT